jgi:hypothetical protein
MPTQGISAAGPAGAAYHGEDQASGGTVAAFPVAPSILSGRGTRSWALAVALAAGVGPEQALTAAAGPADGDAPPRRCPRRDWLCAAT